MIQIIRPGQKHGEIKFGGINKEINRTNIYIKQLINSEAMTSQTENQIGNLCSDFLSSIVCHTSTKNSELPY